MLLARSRIDKKAVARLSRSAVTSLWTALVVSIWVWGCGGGTSSQTVTGQPIERPPDPIVKDAQDIYNVSITTPTGQFLVDKLEIEFNRRRGIHEFYGFYRDQYDQMVRIPFYQLERVDFLGAMPAQLFEQAIIGREHENLQQHQAFEVRLRFREGNQETFFAIIPKFRGEKDLQLWEFAMSNRTIPIDYIEFDR